MHAPAIMRSPLSQAWDRYSCVLSNFWKSTDLSAPSV